LQKSIYALIVSIGTILRIENRVAIKAGQLFTSIIRFAKQHSYYPTYTHTHTHTHTHILYILHIYMYIRFSFLQSHVSLPRDVDVARSTIL